MAQHDLHGSDFGTSTNSASIATEMWDADSGNTPLNAVISAVAAATGSDPIELSPIYDSIDAEALNQLFLSEPSSPQLQVSFQYEGCSVTVEGSGLVTVQPTHDA